MDSYYCRHRNFALVWVDAIFNLMALKFFLDCVFMDYTVTKCSANDKSLENVFKELEIQRISL